MPDIVKASPQLREAWAEELLDRLTPIMSALSVVFLLVVLGEQFARDGSTLAATLAVTGWALWFAFVAEFASRLVVAPDTGRFWRRNWWQAAFLLLPTLRVLRLVRAVRVLRAGRLLSSVVRTSRSARRILGGRVAWLSTLSAIVVLTSSQLLFEFGTFETYGAALHAAALGTISGEPLGRDDALSQVLDVVFACFSVVVFASLAASVGAYFLHGHGSGATDRDSATQS